MSELETRQFDFECRAASDKREITGIAVPWDKVADLGGGYAEMFTRGAVQDSDDALFFYLHGEPIGRVVRAKDTETGWEITAKVSDTQRGNDALTLARDGVLRKLSVGFNPIEAEDVDGVTVRTKVRVREVSLVPFPAYSDAVVLSVRQASSQVREAEPNTKESEMSDFASAADLTEVRSRIDEMERTVSTISTPPAAPAPVDTRSAGEVLKAIVSGDQATIDGYSTMLERAYTGGTTADAIVKDGWVGDLTRIFDASSGALASVFSTGTLPSTGNNIEYAELLTNTIGVALQAAEGDDIGFGKVSITTKTAPVKTYAGGTQLTRQEIERSTIGVLNTSLEALATAAGARKKAVLRTAYEALVVARKAVPGDAGVVVLGSTLALSTADKWEDALVDAAVKFEALSMPLEVLVVSTAVFKKLRSLTVAGERVFQTGPGNASGTLNLPGLTGNLAGLPVLLDSGQAGNEAVFANGRAIRQYDSGLVKLSDENIVNLSKSFAVYKYGAVAAEIPAAVVPVKITP